MRYKSQALLIFFQVSWYLTAELILAEKDSLSFILPAISLTLWFCLFNPHFVQVLKVLTLGIIGLAWDFLLYKLNIITFPSEFPMGMISIWLLFVSVLSIYVEMFFKRKYFGALITGLFAPLSYLAAEKLEVLSIPSKFSIFYLFIFWFFYFLLSHYLLSTTTGKNYGT